MALPSIHSPHRLSSPSLLRHYATSSSLRLQVSSHRNNSLLLEPSVSDQVGKWRVGVSSFPSFLPSFITGKDQRSKRAEQLKRELLACIARLDRGAEASPEDQEQVDQIAQQLEAVNSVKEPLKSDLLNGKWELLYTTSRSILQIQRPKFLRPNGKIYQAVNADTLRAQNMETWPYFNQVTANLVPLNARRVAVQFDTFKIFGLIPIKAPGRARGELEITYLDEELRYNVSVAKIQICTWDDVEDHMNPSSCHFSWSFDDGIADFFFWCCKSLQVDLFGVQKMRRPKTFSFGVAKVYKLISLGCKKERGLTSLYKIKKNERNFSLLPSCSSSSSLEFVRAPKPLNNNSQILY